MCRLHTAFSSLKSSIRGVLQAKLLHGMPNPPIVLYVRTYMYVFIYVCNINVHFMWSLRLCLADTALALKMLNIFAFWYASAWAYIFRLQGCTATDANADVDDLKSGRRQFKRQPLSRLTHTHTVTHTRPSSRLESRANWAAATAGELQSRQVLRVYPKTCCESKLCSRSSLDSEPEPEPEPVRVSLWPWALWNWKIVERPDP